MQMQTEGGLLFCGPPCRCFIDMGSVTLEAGYFLLAASSLWSAFWNVWLLTSKHVLWVGIYFKDL